MDNRLARATEAASEIMIFLLLKMGAVVLFTPIFILPAILVALACGTIGHVYMKAQLSVKREMSNAKAPVLGHFGAAVGGISEYFQAENEASIEVLYSHEQLQSERTVLKKRSRRNHTNASTNTLGLRPSTTTSTGLSPSTTNAALAS